MHDYELVEIINDKINKLVKDYYTLCNHLNF